MALSLPIAEALKDLNITRTILIFNENTNSTVPEAAYASRFGSVGAGQIIWIYKPLEGILPSTLDATDETYLKTNNVTWVTDINDEPIVYGINTVPSGEKIDVMLGVQWIITRMRESVYNVLRNADKVNFDNAGISLIESAMRQILDQAIQLNIIDQDPAYTIVVPDALSFTSQQRSTRKVTGITFRARLAGAIETVDIVGTVYP